MTDVPQPQGAYPPAPLRPSNGMGSAGLMLGIVGLILVWVPGLDLLLGILATTFSAIGYANVRRGSATNGRAAMVGLVLGSFTVLAPIAVFVVLGYLVALSA